MLQNQQVRDFHPCVCVTVPIFTPFRLQLFRSASIAFLYFRPHAVVEEGVQHAQSVLFFQDSMSVTHVYVLLCTLGPSLPSICFVRFDLVVPGSTNAPQSVSWCH